MLGAIATETTSVIDSEARKQPRFLPLRKCFVATNVSSLAGFATLSGFCMAGFVSFARRESIMSSDFSPAARRSSSGSSHLIDSSDSTVVWLVGVDWMTKRQVLNWEGRDLGGPVAKKPCRWLFSNPPLPGCNGLIGARNDRGGCNYRYRPVFWKGKQDQILRGVGRLRGQPVSTVKARFRHQERLYGITRFQE